MFSKVENHKLNHNVEGDWNSNLYPKQDGQGNSAAYNIAIRHNTYIIYNTVPHYGVPVAVYYVEGYISYTKRTLISTAVHIIYY